MEKQKCNCDPKHRQAVGFGTDSYDRVGLVVICVACGKTHFTRQYDVEEFKQVNKVR